MRNFFVSNSTISAACLPESCTATASSCCVDRECKLRASLRSADSASRMRNSRDCWSVESESLMRVTACLSGWMLKLPIVWWISCITLVQTARKKEKTHCSRILVK